MEAETRPPSFPCSYCDCRNSGVMRTDRADEDNVKIIQRRRKCVRCGNTFLTVESFACPKCECTRSRVYISQPVRMHGRSVVMRRRECEHCGNRFITREHYSRDSYDEESVVIPEERF